jgi:hypothetical protein
MAQAEKRKGSAALAEVAGRTMEQLSGRVVVLGADHQDSRIVHIGKLSIDQWLGIAKLALKVAVKMTEDDRVVLAAAAEKDDSNSIATMVTALLDKESLIAALALLAGVEEKWLEKHFSMAEVADLLDAVDEQEDLRRVIAPFQRIAKRWQSTPKPGAKT